MKDTTAKELSGLDVTILGREFRIACPPEEKEGLLESVQYLDARMRAIRNSGKIVGLDRIAMMAALNITHEYLHLKSSPEVDMRKLKRRIEHMQRAVDQAVSE